MKLAGRVLATVIGLAVIWLAVSLAANPGLIVPIPEHGEIPEAADYERTLSGEIARYVAAGLLAFFGLTLAVAPWRRRKSSA